MISSNIFSAPFLSGILIIHMWCAKPIGPLGAVHLKNFFLPAD